MLASIPIIVVLSLMILRQSPVRLLLSIVILSKPFVSKLIEKKKDFDLYADLIMNLQALKEEQKKLQQNELTIRVSLISSFSHYRTN